MQIAIDGPAASGKSTAARILSQKLGFLYIDTGAMYRAVTLEAIKKGISFDEHEDVIKTAEDIDLSLIQDSSVSIGYRVLIKGEDITKELFTPEVDQWVSVTAKIPQVRTLMVQLQRKLAENNNVVMAGRDIGSHVLPKAQLKIFLTASDYVRAERRLKELHEKGEKKDFNEVLDNIRLRDKIDSTRKDNPLIKPSDAVELDCTRLNIEQMAAVIEELAKKEDKKRSGVTHQ